MCFYNICNICLSDSEVERTWLIERVYGPLRLHFTERGYSLEVMDPHWGVPAFISNEHRDMQLSDELIRQCQSSTQCINFVVSLVNLSNLSNG